MGISKLCEELEEKIAVCERECEKNSMDPFLSTVKNSELTALRALYEQLKQDRSKKELQVRLSSRLPELEKAKDREARQPTFDWYDEHHHYKVLEGQCAAYRSVLELLEAENKAKAD